MYRLSALLLVVAMLAVMPAGRALAQEMPPWLQDLPPGIAMQLIPFLEQMREHMMEMNMPAMERQMMMVDMQLMVEELPPGILLQIFELMDELSRDDMMTLHRQIRGNDLLEQPPGQILVYVKSLA